MTARAPSLWAALLCAALASCERIDSEDEDETPPPPNRGDLRTTTTLEHERTRLGNHVDRIHFRQELRVGDQYLPAVEALVIFVDDAPDSSPSRPLASGSPRD